MKKLLNYFLNKQNLEIVKNKRAKTIIFDFFGYQLRKKNNQIKIDDILSKYLPRNPIIFDIGSNVGQSITRFCNIFENPKIHSFEPNPEAFKILKDKFSSKKNIFLNNVGVCENTSTQDFFVSEKSGHSSRFEVDNRFFDNKDIKNTYYQKKKISADFVDLNSYCKDKKVELIDFIKIDTEGDVPSILRDFQYIKKKKISFLEIELRLDSIYKNFNNFSEVENILDMKNYRLALLNLHENNLGNNIFSTKKFALDALYILRDKI